MAHFAKLNDENIVIAVHVVNNDVITIDGKESEQVGIDFLTGLHNYSNWKKTSYNAATNGFRKNYAGIGYTYDEVRNAFIPPEPEGNLGFNEEICQWIMPEDKIETLAE